MEPKGARREEILKLLEEEGGLKPGVVGKVHVESKVPEADIYGVATFYHLLSDPDTDIYVCKGLSCRVNGAAELLEDLQSKGESARFVSCIGRCDAAPAKWDRRGAPETLRPSLSPSGPENAIDLSGEDRTSYDALMLARDHGAEWVCNQLEESGLQGRGGAGFPAHVKWNGVRAQSEKERYVVLNADEGEPGTFKDREVMIQRPHLVIEGLAISAFALEAKDVYVYVRGEFGMAKASLEEALDQARKRGDLDETVRWHFVDGHGAYICGEETALLEALEGKRGMPRMKPPFPVEFGFRGKPTLIQNVETIACVPPILLWGGSWFKNLGKTEPGSKLYCLSGHVKKPGVYEAPLGISMAELLEIGGGADGELKAFSPGGASSGFLPAEKVDVALDFRTLAEEGSMLGSAGVVVLNDTVDMVEAALSQAVFFEDESCGQCSPCRIGTQIVRQTLERYLSSGRDPAVLEMLDEVSWGMREASICGLGQAAALPLTSAIRYFPKEFGR
ncbi:MAG: NADH-ubiquinone oxidoreductase-F iron-sulfur binding region domain-containing protein [Thermoanaerobaculia bacterium]|nr:NADH-ubiquinone oxidoreductase-F iron-sulfur binding region domain-containing protein [Thermoanaerobaculia bacterium]